VSNKYVAARDGGIFLVSSTPITMTDVEIVEVPADMHELTGTQLITDYRVAHGKLRARWRGQPNKNLKLAFVGNWKMQCGISTYSESLLPEIAKHVSDFRLFIEKNDRPTGPTTVVGHMAVSPDHVVQCWKRGEPLGELAKAIKEYDPDVVHIQHEFGIWPNAGYWLSLMNQLSDYRVIVTMHSVFHHRDKTIVEAAMPEIIVHLEGARHVLKDEKGVPGLVHVIPHGCTPVTDRERLWNFYHSEHTLVQWGFGFPYKFWEESIRTTHVLKRKYPDVFFTGLFSESPFNMPAHQVYYDKLMRMVRELDLVDNIAIIRGYQSDQSLDSYLRTNRVALFPYIAQPGHEVWGASGAARYAMSKLLPVVTTNVNHFSDLPTLKGDTAEELAARIDQMWSNPLAYGKQVERQVEYLNSHSWEQMALQHVKLFSGT
jgi:glycosyltransferase involved in cell wall biosynthesis